MMNELYQLERMAKEAYAGYRFPQGLWDNSLSRHLSKYFAVVTALDRFVKITLSSFYLDITKDTLYADDIASTRRRCIIWVMKEVSVQLLSAVWKLIRFFFSDSPDDEDCYGSYSPASFGGDP